MDAVSHRYERDCSEALVMPDLPAAERRSIVFDPMLMSEFRIGNENFVKPGIGQRVCMKPSVRRALGRCG